MDVHKAVKLYRKNSLAALSAAKFLLWLIEEALKALSIGKSAINTENIAERNKQIQIAQQLILEIVPLINGAYDGGKQLVFLIDYMNRRLIEANMKSDIIIIGEVESLLLDLKEAWREVVR
ncbi:flagellar protein FliS [Bacillus ectoiniformans]|uniref:flagellar export chaperone FliS n=1 Tax=Bacillus ectoiniformans TaxID=1494429 RepID=UPI00195D5C9F|nr:flagellar export chaperone FliS [Bacillus ectoiniformans]MBM7649379.1 flagellar protein FliS [Bacillus ectoiniformans]